MIKRISFSILVVFLSTLFLVQGAMADEEIIFKRAITSVTPVFMAGHDGDFEWIEGYDFICNILLNGNPAGTCSGQIRILNPPLDLVERYDTSMIKIYNTITDLGSFEMTGSSTTMGSSSSDLTGDITFAWHSSLSNGTGVLSGIYGWSGGSGSVNIFTGLGGSTEVILYRIGY